MLRLLKQLSRIVRTTLAVRESCFGKRSMTFWFIANGLKFGYLLGICLARKVGPVADVGVLLNFFFDVGKLVEGALHGGFA